ncbi:MAG: hypothetical protein F6K48_20530 [Okeania sp. SIO3H1]|nr:hypothetical protein [Okeania sp. SIO3H1]
MVIIYLDGKWILGVAELVYGINLNYLGVNPPLTPTPTVEGRGSQESGGNKEEKA